jgi:alpha-L-glutamate ligase-like protein
MPATLHLVSSLYQVRGAAARLSKHESFVLKPANSSGGNGILVLKERSEHGGWIGPGDGHYGRVAIERHLANIVFGAFSNDEADKAIVEEKVDFHPLLEELSGGGGDLRILTLKGSPFLAMLRLPTAASGGRANLHQGALGVAVDIETGVTGKTLSAGEPIDKHPDTGRHLAGIQLPHWQEALETARRAAAAMPLGYLGVDILMERTRGPLVVEVNARPGLEIQNVNGSGLGEAIAEVLGGS